MSAAQSGVEIPVQALFDGDALSYLVVLEAGDTIAQACDKVAFGVVGRRIAARPGASYVLRLEDGRVVPDHLTVAEAGIDHSDFIRVGFED